MVTICSKENCSCHKSTCYTVEKTDTKVIFTNVNTKRQHEMTLYDYNMKIKSRTLILDGHLFSTRVYTKLERL